MFPILPIGPLALPAPGMAILIGLWLGLTLAEKNAPRFGIKPVDLYNLVLLMLLSGIIGARLAYILHYPAAFAGNLTSVFSLNLGMLDPWGGLLVGLLVGLIYGQRKRMPLWSTLDALTPMLAVFMLALGFAHLASGAAFGAPADLPWSIDLWGARRHPTQVYEIFAAALILALTWPGRGAIRPARPGVYFLSFTALTAGARLFLEAFRGDSQLILAGLRSAQVIAWATLALCLGLIYWMNNSTFVFSGRRSLPENTNQFNQE
jgi:phosphatidylglycerol---prolipoprotein diacylglyceryl transferase